MNDTEVLELLATRLPHHFQVVVQVYQQRLFAFALRLTGSRQDAEDIVQEAFLNAYVSLENYPEHRIRTLKLQAWLYKVTLNVFTHYARNSRLHIVPLDLAEESCESFFEDREEERPEAFLERKEERLKLECLVAQLPYHSRIAVTCYYFEQLSYREIAELLDQPVGTVKSHVFRGVKILRSQVESKRQEEGGLGIWNMKQSM